MATTVTHPEYRFATEFHFREDQVDDIIRTASYHRRDFELSVIWFSPRQHAGIHLSASSPFQQTSDAGLGVLDQLPTELLQNVLLSLDMHSLFKLRQTSLRARCVVDSLKQYQLVVSHGLNVLCALLRTQLASRISLFNFYDALCTQACAICGGLGGFMFMLTWTRCCFKCLQQAPELQVQSLAAARKQYHLNKSESDQLISLKTLPGMYSIEECVRKSRIKIVTAGQARQVSRQPLETPTLALPAIPTRNRITLSWHPAHFHIMKRPLARVEHGIACAGASLLSKNISSTRKSRTGHSKLETDYTRRMDFWNISDGVSRRSSCGDQAMKATAGQQSYQRVSEEEAF